MPTSTAVDISAVARVLGIKTAFKDLRGGQILNLPQRIVPVGQGSSASSYSTTKQQYTSADAVGAAYGFGSPLHLVARQLFPVNGDGVGTIPVTFYPLEDDASGVVSTGAITPTGTATATAAYFIRVNNIVSNTFVVETGDNVAAVTAKVTAAISAIKEMPMLAVDGTTDIDLTSKWKGSSANDLFIEVVGEGSGITFAVTQPTGGLVNPDVDPSLSQVGDVWETIFLNCMEIADTATLDKFSTFGEGRWGALTRKPMFSFTGNTEITVAAATAVSDARKTDRTNSQLVSPGSNDLPFVVAARQIARIAVVANNNPPRDYGSQDATGLVPGLDGQQWTYADRDQAVKAGSSTIEVKDGVVNLSDTVTFYHPTGETIPPYRFVNDIVKIQTILFNLNLIFATDEWDGAPLLPDADPTVNPSAKKPKMAKAEISRMLDSLGLAAIISDPGTAKDSIIASISSQNPKRLDICFTVQLSGNTNIISIDFNFGFFFGTAQVVA